MNIFKKRWIDSSGATLCQYTITHETILPGYIFVQGGFATFDEATQYMARNGMVYGTPFRC